MSSKLKDELINQMNQDKNLINLTSIDKIEQSFENETQ